MRLCPPPSPRGFPPAAGRRHSNGCAPRVVYGNEESAACRNARVCVRVCVHRGEQGKMGLGPGGHMSPFFCHNGDPLSQPPPAHMGIPPYQLDGKGGAGAMGEYGGPGAGVPPQPHRPISPAEWRRLGPLLAATGLTRPPMYPFSAGQYPYPMLSPEMSAQVASWHTPSMYPLSPGAGFRSPYPSALPISSGGLSSDFYRFSPTGLIQPHPGLSPHPPHLGSHPAIVTPGPKQELPDVNHR
ncbi:hypothetical protein GWI33_002620 [Rhynchophorus ferrugineus]|uniref:Uncharacterized protein n=1 Tax=Rhynchophorus ferrugineus TaxID=354439 RepID=A0A834IR00_RHYFE|nr:hypothetical protein GWI33_002620 [Rhynchophorus ferrugineus]